MSGSHTDGNECRMWSTEYGMKDVRKGKKEGGRGDESREEETDSEYKFGSRYLRSDNDARRN